MLSNIMKESTENYFIVMLGSSVRLQVVCGGRHNFGTQSRADCIKNFSANCGPLSVRPVFVFGRAQVSL